MASTILARDLMYQVSSQLLDAPDAARQFRRWSERELLGYLNEGQRVIAKYLPAACSRLDAVKLKPGTRQSIETIAQADILPSDGSAARAVQGKMLLDVIRNMGAAGTTPGRAVRLVQRDTLDAIDPAWHGQSASEILEYAYDPRTPKFFWVYPGVSGTLWVELSYLANPAEIPYVADSLRIDAAGSTTTLSIDDQFADDLINYMLARAHLKESDTAANAQMANSFASMFVSSINSQAKAMTGVNPNLKVLPFAPEVPGASS